MQLSPSDILKEAATAHELASNGQLSEALEQLDALRESYPDNPVLAYTRVVICFERIPPEVFEKEVANFCKAFPVDPNGHILRALHLRQVGLIEEALAEYKNSYPEASRPDSITLRIGELLIQLARLDEAKKVLEGSVGPGSRLLYYQLQTPENENEIEQMASDLGAAGCTGEEIARAQLQAFERIGLFGKAEEFLRDFLNRHPDNEWAREKLCVTLLRENRLAEARACLALTLHVNPSNVRAGKWLLTDALRRGRLIDGLKMFVSVFQAQFHLNRDLRRGNRR
jgi:predicted Zn-dependent protease